MDVRLFILPFFLILDGCHGCSYPRFIQNVTWRDTTKGRVVYGDTKMTGWAFMAFSQMISDWECYMKDEHFIVSRSTTTIKVFGAEVHAYLCQKLSRIGENAIYYYAMTDEEENADKERVHVTAALVQDVCTVCNPKSSPADEEFRVLVREGTQIDPSLIEAPVVGCNPCVLQCDLPGSPPIPTTTTNKPTGKTVFKIKKENPSIKPSGKNKIKKKSNAGLVVGIVISVLALVSIGVGAAVWYFRFRK
ncbi:uncharacterized protein LOC133196808 [Saccostrea echinata]|uniref:uncharacterized protein LOC133196808 n=1 Tax=Saccostrea echinata TaxID=191078 RepID=UPI002A8253F4|nr:uncharacterized protein LOC133196808 [Saccostrea echinata]